MNIEKDIFEIFQLKTKDNHDLYLAVIEYIKRYENYTLGKTNAEFFIKLLELAKSINNTGYEERRNSDISKIGEFLTYQ